MPIYEFVCQDCGSEFEKIQSFSATTSPNCMSCQSANVLRKMSRPAIHFKGSGWYITDSKGGRNPAGSTEDGSKEKAGDATDKAGSTEKKADKVEPKAEPAKASAAAVDAG